MADNLGFTNPYLDKSVEDSLGDTVKAWNMVQQPAFNSAMVRSGSFGNSGLQQMNDFGRQQLLNSLGRQANDMRSNNYQFDQNFDRGVYNDSFAQGQQQFQNGLNLIGMQNGANQQNLGFGNTIQNTPFNYYTGFANTANSIGQGYGNSNASMSASGSPLMGALGGWQLGSQFGKSFGGWGGGSGNYGFTGAGTPDMGGSSNGNGAYGMFNNPSAYTP